MASRDLVLAIDQGTTGTTAMLVDPELRVIGKVTKEFSQIYPKPGWVEHDLEEIWRSVTLAVSTLFHVTSVEATRVGAIGITNQRETIGIWERATGRPLHHAIVWQCRRTTPRCEGLKKSGFESDVRIRTGLVLDPYFSATKAEWLLDHVPDARVRAARGELVLGTIDTFLVHRLTGGRATVTDASNASRTMLFNLALGNWDPELLDWFRVPSDVLAEVRSSAEVYGTTNGVDGLPDGIPISGIAGDQQAALFGQACFSPGDVKITYGTGAFALVNTGHTIRRSTSGILTTVAWRLSPTAPIEYALEGSVFIAGAAVQWLRDGLGIIASASEIEALARTVDTSADVVFVPALVGLGAPHWRPEARGLICGITRDTTKAHLARACIEAIALECAEVIDALVRDAGGGLATHAIKVDGGAAANDLLLELQAELVKRPVVRPEVIETTALGAAFLAGLGAGLFRNKDEISSVWREAARFAPKNGAKFERLWAKWRSAVTRA